MAISITANKCNFDSYEVTITSPVEPGGGDHIASIDFGDAAMAYALSIKLDGVPIYGGCGLYFTSAGESYTLEVKSNIENSNAAPVLKWTYRVHGLYAPVWADVKGEINIDLNFDSCCASGGTRYFNGSSWVNGTPTITCVSNCSNSTANGGVWGSAKSGSAANNTNKCGPCLLTTTNSTITSFNRDFTGAFSVSANATAFYAMSIVNLPVTVNASASVMDFTGTGAVTLIANKPANSYVVTFTGTEAITAVGATRCANPPSCSSCTSTSTDDCAGCGNNVGSGVASLTALGGCGALVVYLGLSVYRRHFTSSNSVNTGTVIAIGVRE